jgi:ribonuclease G
VDIGTGKNAFIHYWDMIPEDTARLEAEEGVKTRGPPRNKRYAPGEMIKKFPIGSEIVIQITKDAISTKGPRATASISIPGRYLVMMPGSRLKGVSRKIEEKKERERLKKVLARLPVPENNGLIVRTAGSGARKTAFVRDMRGLIDIWSEVERRMREVPAPCFLYQEPGLVERVIRDSVTEDIDRIVVDNREQFEKIKALAARISRRVKGRLKLYDGAMPIFEHFEVEKQLENAFRRKIWLKSGGYLVFDEAEALVAIDVNTGRHKGGNNQEDVIYEVNMEAAEEIARQLRLRNIGGLVIIDFIDMRQRKHQSAVYRKLRDVLRTDRARTNVLPVSPLGIVEMTRQRVEESIHAATYVDCPYCDGHGKVLSALSMSVEIQRHMAEILRRNQDANAHMTLRITIHPSVLDRLRNADEELLIEMEKKHQAHLTFAADANMHIEDFTIADADSGKVHYRHSET